MLRNIWMAISDEDETTEGFLKMILITGQLKGETSLMKWSDVNIDDQIWHIPSAYTKKGKDHIVPLTDVALRILLRMKKINPESEFVFPTIENKSKHYPANVNLGG